MKGNKYSMKIVAEKEIEQRESRGDHGFGGSDYSVSYWKGGGEIRDRTSKKSRLFEIMSREFSEDRNELPPLSESIIRFKQGWGDLGWKPVVKDEKKVTDLVLKQIFAEIDKAAKQGKYPLPCVVPEMLDIRDLLEVNLIEEDPRFRLEVGWQVGTIQAVTRVALPRNSLLLAKDKVANCSADHHSSERIEEELAEQAAVDVEVLEITTSNPEPGKCVSEVSGRAVVGKGNWPTEIEFDIPDLISAQEFARCTDSIDDSKCILEIHESMIKKIIEIARGGRDKHLGLHQEQLLLPCMHFSDPL